MSASHAESIATAPSAFERARQHGRDVERALRTDDLLDAEQGEVEAFVENKGREWAQLMLQGQPLPPDSLGPAATGITRAHAPVAGNVRRLAQSRDDRVSA